MIGEFSKLRRTIGGRSETEGLFGGCNLYTKERKKENQVLGGPGLSGYAAWKSWTSSCA
jgi:hypothetical protein